MQPFDDEQFSAFDMNNTRSNHQISGRWRVGPTELLGYLDMIQPDMEEVVLKQA